MRNNRNSRCIIYGKWANKTQLVSSELYFICRADSLKCNFDCLFSKQFQIELNGFAVSPAAIKRYSARYPYGTKPN